MVGNAVGRQAQVLCTHGIAQATEVLSAHHIPEAEAHVETAVGEARDAASEQGIGAAFAPGAEVGARGFVQAAGHRINEAELATALQVGAHDGGDVFAGHVVATKTDHGKRKLGQAHTRHLDPEQGVGWRERPGEQGKGRNQAENGSPREGGQHVVSGQILHPVVCRL
ncbi:hypothetical protein D9M68_844410 [compost metagenome]